MNGNGFSDSAMAGVPLVAIIDSSESDLMRLGRMLTESQVAHVVGTASRYADAVRLMNTGPDIVIVDAGGGADGGAELFDTVRQIYECTPNGQVILTAGPETHIDPIKAMRAGVRGILHKPVGLPELRELLHELFGTEQRRHRYIADSARSAAEQARPGEVITVFSLKGGVGCTVIAANLAIALQGIIKGKVALLDFSLQSGDIGVLLNVYSTHGVHELMRYTNEMDKSVLDDAMVEHSSGVKVLLAPPTLELVESVDAEGLLSVVRALRKHYDVIVIDTFHSVEEATLELMNISNVLLLVTTPEVPALRNISRLLNLIRSRPELSGKVRTVVNRFPSKGSVSMRDIEDCLGGAPTGTIPSDGRLITQSINEGVSFLQTRSVASDMIMRLAVTLSQPYVERQRRVDTGGKVATMGVPSRSEHRALSLDGGALKI